ncbi:MAG: site-specific DNA-methyltransferase [Selenomonadaceae bacterium]|nr:site-specific DNA-methyltransferase [Selenomonadaceae bacterium]
MYEIYNEDCIEGMKRLKDNSIDLILTDLPYNITDVAWDKKKIDLSALWTEFKRIIKPQSSVLLFGSSTFTFKLYNSNPEWFKYKYCWLKDRVTGFPNAKNRPMCRHEDILVFSDGKIAHKGKSKQRMKYNPQGLIKGGRHYSGRKAGNIYGDHNGSLSHTYTSAYHNYPNDILRFKRPHNDGQNHPTEKPVQLLEYLIRTYTDKGETVLDATMGSGSTGVACVNTNRNFIGFELDTNFYEIAQKRIDLALAAKRQELF